ncbi:hypothetical protein CAPTEDRAFT_186812 [Capitella teleta]|uniref:Uncharacterized protein n=1 Tax=Capitella teleta TaxID=283909 RepID=R7T381_CAPTE|nr:hypothetical protein CAPTEDRAFT_186812 [Capitella teleta]|eukprot:ELT87026.1 hypothetical protein CAPTEDRAFT_186812 [Capitella teleta]
MHTVKLFDIFRDDAQEAKTLLWKAAGKTLIGRSISCRKNETEKIADDIMTALSKLMNAKALPMFAVGPDLLHMIPKAQAQDTLSISVCERLNSIEEELIMMKSLYARVDEIERRIKTTYSMVAAKLPASTKASDRSRPSDSNSGYKLVESRQKKKKRRQAVRKNQVIGTRDLSTLKIAPPPIHYRSVFVARFDTETTTESIETYLKEYGVITKTVERMSKTTVPQASFRVEVVQTDFAKVYDAAFCPGGTLVDKFYNRPKPQNHLLRHQHVDGENQGPADDRIAYMRRLLKGCDIFFIQEHWLYQDDLDRLCLNPDFLVFGTSAMDPNLRAARARDCFHLPRGNQRILRGQKANVQLANTGGQKFAENKDYERTGEQAHPSLSETQAAPHPWI